MNLKKTTGRTASAARAAAVASPRKDLIRESLLDKAAELFVRRGYANTRIQDIAEEMGLARSSLYHYFKSKDEVLQALTEEIAAQSVERLEALRANRQLTPVERLHQAILGSVSSKLHGGVRFRMLDRIEAELPEEIRTAFKIARRRVLELTTEIVESGIQSGHFRPVDAKITAFSILGMSNWTAWWYSPGGGHSPEQIAQTMTDLILGGLLNEEAPSQQADSISATIGKLKNQVELLERLYGAANADKP